MSVKHLSSSRLRADPQPTSKISKSDRTRAEIMDAALEFIWSRPFHEMTVNSLMTSTGVGRSTFYRYFSDLHAVMKALLDMLGGEISVVVQPWYAGVGDPVALLNDTVPVWFVFATKEVRSYEPYQMLPPPISASKKTGISFSAGSMTLVMHVLQLTKSRACLRILILARSSRHSIVSMPLPSLRRLGVDQERSPSQSGWLYLGFGPLPFMASSGSTKSPPISYGYRQPYGLTGTGRLRRPKSN